MKLIKTEAAVELELDQASERLLKPFTGQAKANESELYYYTVMTKRCPATSLHLLRFR